ncbi:hypothetical protein Dimus_031429 [Dionaea muscipula]
MSVKPLASSISPTSQHTSAATHSRIFNTHNTLQQHHLRELRASGKNRMVCGGCVGLRSRRELWAWSSAMAASWAEGGPVDVGGGGLVVGSGGMLIKERALKNRSVAGLCRFEEVFLLQLASSGKV